MTIKLKNAIMVSSRPRNTFLKHPTNENKEIYEKQRNFRVSLLRKEKKNYFENLDTKNISDNKIFRKTVKALLSNKCRLPVNVKLVKENDVISDNSKIADVFNDFFTYVIKNLNIAVSGDILYKANNIKDPVLKSIENYKKHPNIKAIAGLSKNDNFVLEKSILRRKAAWNETVRYKKGV